jgi:hypothetical protein
VAGTSAPGAVARTGAGSLVEGSPADLLLCGAAAADTLAPAQLHDALTHVVRAGRVWPVSGLAARLDRLVDEALREGEP